MSNALLQSAIQTALTAHGSQVDKEGKLYILHPLRVMLKGKNIHEQIVGVLHDVIEDTSLDYYDIEQHFGQYIATAVDALTRRPQELYTDFILRVKQNELTTAVKLNDLEDNLSLARFSGLSESLNARYLKARLTLRGEN